ncbi:MAG: FeoA domain-containing protein [Rhodothermales bacterium]
MEVGNISIKASEYVALGHVRSGDEGVLHFVGAGDATVQRLMSMGLIPGAAVKVVRIAPLGDPIMLEISGYHVCVRRREAAGIFLDKTIVETPSSQLR